MLVRVGACEYDWMPFIDRPVKLPLVFQAIQKPHPHKNKNIKCYLSSKFVLVVAWSQFVIV